MTRRTVTAFLFVGEAPASLQTEAVYVASAEHAVAVLARRGTAVLPPGRWDLAAETLLLQTPGAPLTVRRTMHFATTGSLRQTPTSDPPPS